MLKWLATMALFSLFGCASTAPHSRESIGTIPPDVGSPFPPPTWASFDRLPPEPSNAAAFGLQARIIRGNCGTTDTIESALPAPADGGATWKVLPPAEAHRLAAAVERTPWAQSTFTPRLRMRDDGVTGMTGVSNGQRAGQWLYARGTAVPGPSGVVKIDVAYQYCLGMSAAGAPVGNMVQGMVEALRGQTIAARIPEAGGSQVLLFIDVLDAPPTPRVAANR